MAPQLSDGVAWLLVLCIAVAMPLIFYGVPRLFPTNRWSDLWRRKKNMEERRTHGRRV